MPDTDFKVILRPIAPKEKANIYLTSDDHHTITETGVDRPLYDCTEPGGRIKTTGEHCFRR